MKISLKLDTALRRVTKIFGVCVALSACPAMAQGQGSYVLPMPSANSKALFVDEVFKDPVLVKKDYTDAQDRATIEANNSELESDLTRAQKSRRQGILRGLLTGYAGLVDFMVKASDGRIAAEAAVSVAELQATRQKLISYAKQILASKPSAQDQALAQYAIISQSFVMSGRFNIPAALLSNRIISERMRSRYAFIDALQKGDRSRAASISRSFGKLARIGALQLIAKNKPKAEDLNAILAASANLPNESREKVVQNVSGMMIRLPGFDWRTSPISVKSFAGTSLYYPMLERMAAAHLRGSDEAKAKALYISLAKSFEGKPDSAAFDKRILAIEKRLLARSKDSKSYEAQLGKLRDKYRDEGVLGAENAAQVEQMRTLIESEHKTLVDQAIAMSDKHSSDRALRVQAIGLASRFSARTTNEAMKQDYQGTVARLFAADGQHAKAVTLFMDLSLNGEEKNRTTYLRAAIKSQQVLAGWPDTAPWTLKGVRNNKQSLSLQNMYGSLIEKEKDKTNWVTLAHYGLLQVVNGQTEAAFTLWTDAIPKAPSHAYANQAASFMLQRYTTSKAWPKLESTARLALKFGLSSDLATSALGTALFNGGKELVANQDFVNAAKKLKEFCANYQRHPQRDEGLFVLAQAYRGSGQHVAGIETLRDLTKEYPRSRFLEAAYTQGGDAAVSMALEELTIYFYQGYLDRFLGGKNSQRISAALVDLYVGRELFAEAIYVLKSRVATKSLAKSIRLDAAERWLDIEERNGSLAAATTAASYIVSMPGNDDARLKGRAYAAIAREQLAKNDSQGHRRTEAALANLAAETVEAQEYLGEVRFYSAAKKAKIAKKEINNLELKDPLATLNREYQGYLEIKATFDSVCGSGVTSFCAPSLTQIAMVADETIPRLDDISIPDTLEKKIVDAFNDRKDAIISKLSDDNRQLMELSVQKMKETHTRPDWTQQILWENSADWNFDRITGEAGNGYVQFEPTKTSAE